MPLSRFLRPKHLAGAFLVVLLIAGALRIAFPFLVQTETVERGIEQTLENWTGAEVHIGKDAEFAFWPYPRVTLGDVRILGGEEDGASGELASIETISATFDLLGAVRGRPAFSDFELVRPAIRVGWSTDGVLNWRHSGWLMQAIDATARAPEGQPAADLPDERIGTISIRDGVLDIARGDAEPYRFTGVNGSITWPALRQRLDLSLSGAVNGEVARWSFSCDQPLSLLAGRDATVRTNLSADPTTVGFEGTANLSGNAFVSGAMQLSTPSLSHLLAWQGKDIPAVGNIGQVNVEANVTTSGYSAKLENVRLTLDNAQATGVLDIGMPPEGVPQVDGTLAFDRIDLRAFLSAFSPLPGTDQNAPTIDTAFIHQFGMDLRLSAKTADFAPFSLQDLAAGMRIENGRASFDIGDSTFMDGRMTGRIALAENGFRGGGQLQMSLSNVDIGGVVSALALPGPLPSGIGSADFELSTDRPLWATTVSDMSGRFRLRMGPGTLTHFNRQAFEERAARNAFFRFSEAANGSFDFVRADVEARLDRGLAELTKAEIEGNEKLLTLSGMIPYRTGSVALAGTLADRPQAGNAAVKPAISFFVGGSWPEPVISPVSILTGQPPRQ
ncbi:AsmA-like C-terminal region-containing protein [Shinella sp. BYT-45]|uniref:AsmA family protein n=1 Tax=Shinella sp. BYT-45 TaxID=3377377 RepID=UPI00397FC6DE